MALGRSALNSFAVLRYDGDLVYRTPVGTIT